MKARFRRPVPEARNDSECQNAGANAGGRSRFIERPAVVLYRSSRVAEALSHEQGMSSLRLCGFATLRFIFLTPRRQDAKARREAGKEKRGLRIEDRGWRAVDIPASAPRGGTDTGKDEG